MAYLPFLKNNRKTMLNLRDQNVRNKMSDNMFIHFKKTSN